MKKNKKHESPFYIPYISYDYCYSYYRNCPQRMWDNKKTYMNCDDMDWKEGKEHGTNHD